MRIRFTYLLLLIFLSCLHVSAQEKAKISLDNFVGNWTVDKEKTYSKSERKSVVNYTVKISRKDKTVTVYWDYTIRSGGKDNHSYYHDDFVLDGKEKETKRGDTWGPWAQKASFDGKKLKCRYNYRTTQQTAGAYLDHKTFSFSKDNKYLVIESVFRSSGRFTPTDAQSNTLYLVKEN